VARTLYAGEVQISARSERPAAAEFGALRMRANPSSAPAVHTYSGGTTGETDKPRHALRRPTEVDSIITAVCRNCARPREVLIPIPSPRSIRSSSGSTETFPLSRHRSVPPYLTTVNDGGRRAGRGRGCREASNESSRPAYSPSVRAPTPYSRARKDVVLSWTAKDLHVGPTREWVELYTRMQRRVSQAVRWDRHGLAFRHAIRRAPFAHVYSKADITDSIAVARHACQDGGNASLSVLRRLLSPLMPTALSVPRSAIPGQPRGRGIGAARQPCLYAVGMRRKALNPDAVVNADGGGPAESRTKRRLNAFLRGFGRRRRVLAHPLPAIRPAGAELGRPGLWRRRNSDKRLPSGIDAMTLIVSPEA